MQGARRFLPAAALIAVTLVPSPAGAATDAAVTVGDSFFDPETVVVEAGSTVLWTQEGSLPHSVTADDSSFDSHPACSPTVTTGCMQEGDTYSRVFDQPGIFPYYCKVHGGAGGSGMSGVVKVVDETGVVPTTIVGLTATAGGGTVSVGGTAAFGGQAPVTVGTDPAGDSTQPAPLGYDLTGAQIGQPDPETGDLLFALDLADLPPSGGLPEVARYTWDFAVNEGRGIPTPFEVDGKLTDVIRRQSTNVPAFVLRGNCVTENNVITCEDVATLEAAMDAAAARITVTVPRKLLEAQTEASIAGTVIEPATICEGISAKASAYFSLCGGAVGPATGDAIVQDPETDVYRVASPTVELGIVPAGAAPAYPVQAVVAEDGSFEGSLDTSGLAAGDYDVVARACFGTNCGTSSTRITL